LKNKTLKTQPGTTHNLQMSIIKIIDIFGTKFVRQPSSVKCLFCQFPVYLFSSVFAANIPNGPYF